MNLREVIGDPGPRDLRVFAMLQIVFFGVIVYVIHRQGGPAWMLTALLATSLGVAVLGGVRPRSVRPVYVVWMTAVFPIGWTVSHVALGLVYYLVLTPIGLVRRMFSGDPLQRKIEPDASTYWHRRPPPRPSKSYFKQF